MISNRRLSKRATYSVHQGGKTWRGGWIDTFYVNIKPKVACSREAQQAARDLLPDSAPIGTAPLLIKLNVSQLRRRRALSDTPIVQSKQTLILLLLLFNTSYFRIHPPPKAIPCSIHRLLKTTHDEDLLAHVFITAYHLNLNKNSIQTGYKKWVFGLIHKYH